MSCTLSLILSMYLLEISCKDDNDSFAWTGVDPNSQGCSASSRCFHRFTLLTVKIKSTEKSDNAGSLEGHDLTSFAFTYTLPTHCHY